MQQRAYRAFKKIGQDGHVAGRIDLRYCPNDEAAKQWAKLLVDGKTIELWDGSIARFEPKKIDPRRTKKPDPHGLGAGCGSGYSQDGRGEHHIHPALPLKASNPAFSC